MPATMRRNRVMGLRSFIRRIEDLPHPFEETPRGQTPPARPMRFLFDQLGSYREILVLAAIFGTVVAILELGLIWYAGRLVDLMSRGPEGFWQAHGGEVILAGIFFLLLRPIAVAVNAAILFCGISTNMLPQVRWRAHRHMLGQPVNFFQSDFAGRLSNRVMNLGPAAEDLVFVGFEAFWQAGAFAIATLILLLGMDWRLALPLAVWIGLFVLFVVTFAPVAKRASEKFNQVNSMTSGRIVDSYTNIETVKLFADARREEAFALSALRRLRLRFGVLMRFFAFQQGAMAAFNSAAMLMVIGPAIWLWSISAISIGEVAAAIAMALRLNTMTGWIMWMTIRVYEHFGVMAESLQSVAVEQTVRDVPDAPPLVVTEGRIEIEGLSHHYGKEAGGLDNLDLVIPGGQRVGLVGPSGAGKSSLVNLILRFRDIEDGRILIDGQDISLVRQETLRGAIGMVTQDSSLLHRSVRANLLYGRPDATEEQMIRAAKRAEAHDFILALEDPKGRRGYNAHVGERGVKLSGGQRQRIALARVLLRDAPILVLDEATSALDSEVEAVIQRALESAMEGKTVIAIAHRLSTIARMDRIVVMQAGRIVEDGTHDGLLAKGGLYAQYWSRQSGGFLSPESAP